MAVCRAVINTLLLGSEYLEIDRERETESALVSGTVNFKFRKRKLQKIIKQEVYIKHQDNKERIKEMQRKR